MPSDPHAFISENKDRDFDGESVYMTDIIRLLDHPLNYSHR